MKKNILLPDWDTGMNNPLENDIYSCPQDEVGDPEPWESLKAKIKQKWLMSSKLIGESLQLLQIDMQWIIAIVADRDAAYQAIQCSFAKEEDSIYWMHTNQ